MYNKQNYKVNAPALFCEYEFEKKSNNTKNCKFLILKCVFIIKLKQILLILIYYKLNMPH